MGVTPTGGRGPAASMRRLGSAATMPARKLTGAGRRFTLAWPAPSVVPGPAVRGRPGRTFGGRAAPLTAMPLPVCVTTGSADTSEWPLPNGLRMTCRAAARAPDLAELRQVVVA